MKLRTRWIGTVATATLALIASIAVEQAWPHGSPRPSVAVRLPPLYVVAEPDDAAVDADADPRADRRGTAFHLVSEQGLRFLLAEGHLLNPTALPLSEAAIRSVETAFARDQERLAALVDEMNSIQKRVVLELFIERGEELRERQPAAAGSPPGHVVPKARWPGEIVAVASDGRAVRIVRVQWGDDPALDASRQLVREATDDFVAQLREQVLQAASLPGGLRG